MARPMCFAHRGGGRDYPDNSLIGIEASVKNKIDGIEIDIQTTKEGTLVLVHDHDLTRVAIGADCPTRKSIKEIPFDIIQNNCQMLNSQQIATFAAVAELIKDAQIDVLLDLKTQLTESNVKTILESGIRSNRLRLSAFYPEYLSDIRQSMVLTNEQVEEWNSLPRFEHFRRPIFRETSFRKSLHLFSAFLYGKLGRSDSDVFGAWEVNYGFFLNLIIPLQPDFIVTKIPLDCMKLRGGHSLN